VGKVCHHDVHPYSDPQSVCRLYAVTQGYVGLNQVERGIITDVVFDVALLAFYPWRAKQDSA